MAEDHFSKQAKTYAQYRPEYPRELFAFLASQCKFHRLAWDCATGSGQAARSLSPLFDKVIATDLSAEQIAHASAPSNVVFKVAAAEEEVAAAESVDLITIAQALHWFNFESFYSIAKKALAPGGVIAAWSYGFFKISPELDQILDPYGRQYLAPYWSPKNWLIINEYRDVPFPFIRIQTPPFELAVEWNFDELLGYLDSWSATQKFKDAHGKNPIESIQSSLQKVWGPSQTKRRVSSELTLLVGKQ